jgi:type IX secretion system PorP/SprF family membrane protein
MKYIIVSGLSIMSILGYAQQQPTYNQYALNPLTINPAYAGANNMINLTASFRQQWTAFEGAPRTITFTGHSPIEGIKSGVGLQIIADNVGSISQTQVYGSYSYKINFDFGTLSAGLSLGVNQLKTDYADAFLNGIIDPTFASGDVNQWKINSGFGLFLSGDKFYTGFSIPQMLGNQFQNSSGVDQYQVNQQFYLAGGHIFDLGESRFSLKPYTLIRMAAGTPFNYDINLQAYYNDLISLGLQYRSTNSMAILFEFILNKTLFIGYSYEFNYGDNFESINTGGSHEIVLSYLMPWSKDGQSGERIMKFY